MIDDEKTDAVNPYREEPPVEMIDLSPASMVLQQARPWVLFLGVIAMGIAILLVLGTIGMLLSTALDAIPLPLPAWVFVALYLVGAVVYFLPALFLLKFNRRIKEFSQNQTVGQLNAALLVQKSFWKTIGICAMCFLALYLVMIVAAVFTGVSVN
jgi:hypothetical protein